MSGYNVLANDADIRRAVIELRRRLGELEAKIETKKELAAREKYLLRLAAEEQTRDLCTHETAVKSYTARTMQYRCGNESCRKLLWERF